MSVPVSPVAPPPILDQATLVMTPPQGSVAAQPPPGTPRTPQGSVATPARPVLGILDQPTLVMTPPQGSVAAQPRTLAATPRTPPGSVATPSRPVLGILDQDTIVTTPPGAPPGKRRRLVSPRRLFPKAAKLTGPEAAGAPPNVTPFPGPASFPAAAKPTLASRAFTLHHRMGAGAHGDVWVATDTRTGATVAVKVVAGNSARLQEEIDMLTMLASECAAHRVVCYLASLGATTADGRPGRAIVMSLAPGAPRTVKAAISDSVLRRWARQLLGAVQYLHSRGVLHRDIKPANVVFNGDDLTLVDLGLACTDCPELYGGVVGTPHYTMPRVRAAMAAATRDSPAFISVRDLALADYWAAAATLLALIDAKPTDAQGPTAAMLRQLQREAEDGDEDGVAAIVARFAGGDSIAVAAEPWG